MTRAARIAFWALCAFLAVGVALYGLRYVFLGPSIAPPNIASNATPVPHALILHAAGAGIALLVGPWQFIAGLRAKAPRVHRWIGRTYACACIFGGLAGLALAPFSSAGPIAQSGFTLLALAWLATTSLGWRAALARDFAAHQDWMLRSFALAFAAVTLRLYTPIPYFTGLDPDEAYRWIAWLCWIPNLVLVELWLRARRAARIGAASAAP
ncbi:MAG: DUF2306 domain-containing protein [Hyphomonadaceae bacterium]|nr:DUF2306 domain-containing protein [Hyphomonadaceae bacterium]